MYSTAEERGLLRLSCFVRLFMTALYLMIAKISSKIPSDFITWDSLRSVARDRLEGSEGARFKVTRIYQSKTNAK